MQIRQNLKNCNSIYVLETERRMRQEVTSESGFYDENELEDSFIEDLDIDANTTNV